MPRIAGVDIPGRKRVKIALTYVYGIGRSRAMDILERAGITPDSIADELSDDQLAKIRSVIDSSYPVEGNLRREVSMNIKRLIDLGTYRGLRHKKNLPVRGQRTKTNSRTRKGPRKTVAGKKKAPTSK
ncbi:MAG: 30S ribosomal protein S13 [Deltaproteobacteria bacterium RIFCSPLOWO2_12_FULL_40_28]|nr:MAG: 30S ribosomal protein S13 [Deltaproteobacteria bacterium RIFCSPHIGHO2_02_FULL_40_28]OGQ18985.1 MAG: 30S ribosomal protein S13 [Deltaproteobacteria bacterium RIFCSPHIGHO2_12_FULL_40_32]OGQ39528.1 MAG: 30S ribosomal protein S13 [Deltaproteobacteria bacterium RIFCSPLOWO2_02_FULL_40_36]OGQ53418.1 MAG: 30S ribosomal protein S13 [Deltaproteobacteria bacterium RIFCSPLOWO2_12_FULL_40_28]